MQSQDPESQKNLMLAVVLSMAVMLGWQVFVAGPQIQKQREQMLREEAQSKTTTAASQTGVQQAEPVTSGQASGTGVAPEASASPAATRDEALARSPRLKIETPSLRGSIALKGGLVDDLTLVNYRETVDPKSPNVVLFHPSGTPHAYFAKYGWLNAGSDQSKLPTSETLWMAMTNGPLTPSSPATLVWDNGEGLIFKRTISVDDHYMISVTEEVENKSAKTIALRPFALIYRQGTPKTTGGVLHEGLIGVLGDEGLEEITYSDALDDGPSVFNGMKGGWLGISDLYWASTLIPDQAVEFDATFQGKKNAVKGKEFFTVDYTLAPAQIAAGQTYTTKSNLYAGAKQVNLIEGYERSRDIKLFNKLIDWGWFHFFTRPLNYLLTWLYGILGNFGLAILAVTVLVKAAFYPLANKSYESMAKMKKLQPQMEALRERFKDDKARQQQEIMQLYQKEKINPLAGCLPILVQIPVFFALYKVLFISIDMRHAPFYGWIKDLSAADPTSIFNLFGLLPFAVPEFLHIGAWPVIMGITMWIQMQLNPPQPDPVQQAVFSWMPLIFTFLLASFSAGLVIYWAWNNVLSIAQQWTISKRQGAEIHLMDNLKKTFGPVAELFRKRMGQKPK
jgi:YidC/Oxa1 family membrane protein insertase